MLTATNHDGPALHTRSRTVQCNMTDLTPETDTVTPDITNITDTSDATPKPLTEDRPTNPTTDTKDRPIL